MKAPFFPVLCLPLFALEAQAFTPEVNSVLPRGGQRGTEVELRINGQRLENPQEILFHQPGLEVLELKQRQKDGEPNPDALSARIKIADDAPLGEHAFRVRTSGGVSYLRTFWVGQFPTLDEAEPNNAFESPQPIELNTTVHGVAEREDEDYYKVSLKEGQQLSVEVEAMRLGRTFFDAYVAILGPDGAELATCDDAPLLYTDCFASIIAPADGDYRILVREAAYEGDGRSDYRLHVGTFPRPSAVMPTGARPGETVTFRFIGDPSGELTREITIPQDADGRFPVFAERDGLTSPSPNWIHVSPIAWVNEKEPNDGSKQANPAPEIPCAVHGVLSKSKDVDWFRFTARKDEELEFNLLGRALRSPIDSVLILRDSKNKQLASNDDQGSVDSQIKWKCPEDGEYLINVRDKLERSGPDFTYRLEITRKEPSILATLPVAERNNSQARKMIGIPRGGRYATVVNITRSDLRCDALFKAADLPPGVTMQVPAIPGALNNFPVIFEAAADAPVAGGYSSFSIHATGENTPEVSGPLREEIHHIEINNQGVYHSTFSEHTAVAVIDEAPFSIELESPKVPLVQRGSMELQVRAKRSEGFEKPVRLTFLWKPPGIGTPADIQLKEKTNDIGYEVNANADAPPGEWQVCVLGEADTDQGPVIVSSNFVTLRVAEPYLTAGIEISATEQGRDARVLCNFEQLGPFEGTAIAELVGLPHGATTDPLELTKDTAELIFPVAIADDAAIGKHNGLFLKIRVPENGDTILHQTGHGGTLRIDKPRVVAKSDDKPKEAAKETAATGKPLSRLEQLRQQAK